MIDIPEFVDDYYRRFIQVLSSFDREPLVPIAHLLQELATGEGTLWIAGNGGSAAISNHTVCDVTKGTHVEGQPVIRSSSLASNVPMMTALANDLDYEDIFLEQLRYHMRPGDALLVVSSSGNSPNVVRACRFARDQGIPTVAFVGFDGGELLGLADHVVWIPIDNYGMVEDAHQSLVHVLTQYLRQLFQEQSQGRGER